MCYQNTKNFFECISFCILFGFGATQMFFFIRFENEKSLIKGKLASNRTESALPSVKIRIGNFNLLYNLEYEKKNLVSKNALINLLRRNGD
jgi:hypothetical protein